MKPLLTACIALLFASPAFAHETFFGSFHIIHPAITMPVGAAKVAAGYMAISNEGATDDVLIGVEVGFAAEATIHSTEVDANGVARMMHVRALPVPAEDTVVLEQGGYHIMLTGLTAPISVGEMLPATLIFEKAGRVPFEFMVDPSFSAVDHSTMNHSTMAAGLLVSKAADVAAIEAQLKALLDTPEAPLGVAPVTISGEVAIAGWRQDGRAGRAFLRRDDAGWFVVLCSGPSLLLPATLQSLGLGAAAATELRARVQTAEAVLGADITTEFDSFAGTLLVGRTEP